MQLVLRALGQPLEPAHRVVGEITHPATAEARQPGQRHGLVRLEEPRELLHGRARESPDLPALVQLALAAAGDEHERGPAAEDGVAPPLLPALDALEQE